MKGSYFSMKKFENEATINIYGDISSAPWDERNVDVNKLSKQLEELGDVSKIDVYINSYGGEVAEGLAIYNALKRHKAKVVTHCDGFACSIASVIFMAGDERIMNDSSLLMIHNAWSYAMGNADELRKQADDLEIITQASVIAYKAHSNLSEEEIKTLMDNESWLLPEKCLEYGFATSIEKTENNKTSQNAKMKLLEIIKEYMAKAKAETDEDDDTEPQNDPEDTEDESNTNTQDEDSDDTEATSEDEDDENNEDDKPSEKLNNFLNAILKI